MRYIYNYFKRDFEVYSYFILSIMIKDFIIMSINNYLFTYLISIYNYNLLIL